MAHATHSQEVAMVALLVTRSVLKQLSRQHTGGAHNHVRWTERCNDVLTHLFTCQWMAACKVPGPSEERII